MGVIKSVGNKVDRLDSGTLNREVGPGKEGICSKGRQRDNMGTRNVSTSSRVHTI